MRMYGNVHTVSTYYVWTMDMYVVPNTLHTRCILNIDTYYIYNI